MCLSPYEWTANNENRNGSVQTWLQLHIASNWREELTNSTYLLNTIPVKCKIFPLDNLLSLCTIVATVEGQLTYDKFTFTVLVTEPESELQMVLMEMEKKIL